MRLLACDLGGTWMKLGLLEGGRIVAQEVIPAHSDIGLGPRLPDLAAALRRLVASRGLKLSDCAGVAVSFPALVNPETGRILDEYGKYRDAPGVDLPAWAKQTLGLPLAIENDARMALIGEWQHGAGRGCDNLVIVTLGTGIGTSALIQGRVLRGQHGQAGCLSGHLSVRYSGRKCSCGNLGCAEAEASTAFLAEIAAERADFAASALRGEPVLDYAAVFRHAAAGDSCAAAIRDHSLLVWATLVVNLIVAYDPERVIIGGGILASRDVILPAIQQYVDRHAHTPWGRVRVVGAELGDASALHAAEWLLRDKFPRLNA
jgi:glucokinase